MHKILPLLLCLTAFNDLFSQQNLPVYYPEENVQEIFFGKTVNDPYRGLEDYSSGETQNWLKAQEKANSSYYKHIESRQQIEDGIEEMAWVIYDRPVKQGPYFFKQSIVESGETARLYIKLSPTSDYIELVNPNKVLTEERFTISDYSLSGDAKYLAYQYARNGSDWNNVDIVNVSNLKTLEKDHLTEVAYSDIVWKGNGFFYQRYKNMSDPNELTRKVLSPSVYYHKINTPQSDDSLIFKRDQSPKNFFHVTVTSDERFFILQENDYNKKTQSLFYVDYTNPMQKLVFPLSRNQSYNTDVLDNVEGRLLALTNKESEYKMIVSIDPAAPNKWDLVIPVREDYKIEDALVLKDKIAVLYSHDDTEELIIYSIDGKPLHKIKFPFGRHCSLSGQKNDKQIMLSFQSYFTPPSVYFLDVNTYNTEQVDKTHVNYNYEDFEYEALSYKSFDGTEVPLYLVHKKGLKKNSTAPTLLTAYGGYGISKEPAFDPGIVYFIEKGGIYAYAGVRGGGEKGERWHAAGARLNKQNCFSDFIKAAEFLIDQKYTSSQYLAITGGSHGGLVVGAAMTQRPELFKVAIPEVGVLDMMRFQQNTIGEVNTNEFGDLKNEKDFENMLSYSPYHHINKAVAYPHTLVITGENDTRVPPLHSYKFFAALQHTKNADVLLQVNRFSGHNGASDHEYWLKQTTNFYAFIFYSMGLMK